MGEVVIGESEDATSDEAAPVRAGDVVNKPKCGQSSHDVGKEYDDVVGLTDGEKFEQEDPNETVERVESVPQKRGSVWIVDISGVPRRLV